MNPKYLVMDYDGTLSNGDGIDDELAALMQQLRLKGVRVIVATGRPKNSLPDLEKLVKSADALVLEEGGVILTQDKEALKTNDAWQAYVNSLPEGLTYAKGNVLIITDDSSLDALLSKAKEMKAEYELQPYKSWYFLTPKGVSKLSSVMEVINGINESGPTLFVGDELNDLELVRWADCSVAVRNASEKVKSECDLVLDEDDGKGVKKLLRSIISGRFTCEHGPFLRRAAPCPMRNF
ncbi:HAD family hydrolase [Tardisphaera miroshnichenkoae]